MFESQASAVWVVIVLSESMLCSLTWGVGPHKKNYIYFYGLTTSLILIEDFDLNLTNLTN